MEDYSDYNDERVYKQIVVKIIGFRVITKAIWSFGLYQVNYVPSCAYKEDLENKCVKRNPPKEEIKVSSCKNNKVDFLSPV